MAVDEAQAPPDLEVMATGDLLGESPQWLPAEGRLARIDMGPGVLHVLDPQTGIQESLEFGPPIGFVMPRQGGGFVVGLGLTIVLIDADGSRRTLVDLTGSRDAERFNDAVCDAAGRLWVGTLSSTRTQGAAALFMVTPAGDCTEVLSGLTISNGMDFLDGDLLHADTATGRIDRYPRDPETGALGERATFAEIPEAEGRPDGLTVDADGGVWVALFGGGEVRRYRANGTVDRRVRLPMTPVTSVVFGGDDLGDLYVTTGRYKLSDEALAEQPLAGALLRFRPGMRGRPQHVFGG